jgi:hypothetical protein
LFTRVSKELGNTYCEGEADDAQEHPRKLEEAHITSIGEDSTHWDVDALTTHSKPRAKRSSWDTGPPPAATDAQGKSGYIRQPLAVGEWIVAVDATAVALLQVEKDTAMIRRPQDTPETLTIAPAAVGIPPCDTAPARTPVPRKLRHERPVRAYKSRSPKEISALVDFIMAHPDSVVDAPRGLAQHSGVSTNLTKMFVSDRQTFRVTISS